MQQGDFVWHELCTTASETAAGFYGKVLGWTMKPSPVPGIDYTLACIGDHPVAGIMTLPPAQMPPHPVWCGYVAVNDVDAKAEEISETGGTIHKAPEDIPGIGRFAVASDPQGAVFMLFKGFGEAPPPLSPMTPGAVAWCTLHTKDAARAWDFYERLFGWQKDRAYDMGPMGSYQTFKASALPIGGFMDLPEVPPSWLYYFAVDNIDAAIVRTTENGGTILRGPDEVPGGAWTVIAKDPQGGTFAVVGMRTA